MNNIINNDSPLGEDFYNFQKEDTEVHSKAISKLKVTNKKDLKNNDNENSVKISYSEEENYRFSKDK